MRVKEAQRILGIVNGYTVDAVKEIFHAKVRAMHPDNGGTGGDLSVVTEARDVIIRALVGETSCRQCGGRGYIKARLGSVECGRCGGEGIVAP